MVDGLIILFSRSKFIAVLLRRRFVSMSVKLLVALLTRMRTSAIKGRFFRVPLSSFTFSTELFPAFSRQGFQLPLQQHRNWKRICFRQSNGAGEEATPHVQVP